VKLWRASDGQLVRTLRGHATDVESVAFSPDGGTLASSAHDGIKLWDLGSKGSPLRLQPRQPAPGAWGFPPDRTLALGGTGQTWGPAEGRNLIDGIADLWDLERGRVRATLRGHLQGVASMGLSADGRLLATASRDGTVRLWDTAKGAHVATIG